MDVEPPSPLEGLILASQLLNGDGCRSFLSFFRTGEGNDPGMRQLSMYMKLPRFLKYLHYLFVKYVKQDIIWAEILKGCNEKSVFDQWQLVSRREAYKAHWHDWWNRVNLDFLLVPVSSTPAVPHGGMASAFSACNYTFLFNLVRLSEFSRGAEALTRYSWTIRAACYQ